MPKLKHQPVLEKTALAKTGYCTKGQMREFLKVKLGTSPSWAKRALLLVYSKQTDFEQEIDATMCHNNEGFSSYDAHLMSSFSKQLIEKKFLSRKQMAILFKRMPHYWAQVQRACDSEKLRSQYNLENGIQTLVLEQ